MLLTRRTFTTWGLSGTVAVAAAIEPGLIDEVLWRHVEAIDGVANRFRADNELSRLNERSGWHDVSSTMERLLDAATDAYRLSDGLCDPTVLPALVALGYDKDFELVRDTIAPASGGAACVGLASLERAPGRLHLPDGCGLDFGATAKALLADDVAEELHALGGVVVEVGGDVAIRGEGPDGPWAIGVASSLARTGDEPRIVTTGGGVATSSTEPRSWSDGRRRVHHVIDPRTGDCALGPYVTATVTTTSCVAANALSTAALIWGDDAPRQLAERAVAARLIDGDGSVEPVGGWHREVACSR